MSRAIYVTAVQGRQQEPGLVLPAPEASFEIDPLESWIVSSVADAEAITSIQQFTSGKANLTYLLKLAGGGPSEVILRRPPLGILPAGGHAMSREYHVLERLWKGFPLAPRALAYCDDAEVIGAPFMLMERRDGVVIQDDIPDFFGGGEDPVINRAISTAVVETLARLHSVDPQEVGLNDLGKPDGFMQRQVEGWTHRMLAAGYEDPDSAEELSRWLANRIPQPQSVSVLHNDWRIDNLGLDSSDPSVCIAVYDWDMCTRGDPLADLGTLLSTWYEPGEGIDSFAPTPTHVPGFLTADEVIAVYQTETGLDTSDVWWYVVFGTLKMAAILQQIFARWERGESTDPRFESLGDAAARLVDLAQQRRSSA